MRRTIFFLSFAFIAFNNLYSQDTIVKRNNERIICKIKEIGSDEIKYQPLSDNIIIGIDKNKVVKVVLASGMVMNFHNSMDDLENYKDNNKNCLKFTLLSPLYGYSGFTWEHSIKPGSSFECSLGIIGLGKKTNELATYSLSGSNCTGVTMRIGYKFINIPDFYLKDIREANVLNGLYVRPEIILTDYNQPTYYSNINSVYNIPSNRFLNGAVLLNFGNQLVINNTFIIDMFIGFGYGIGTNSDKSNNEAFSGYQYYGYFLGSSNEPITISTGLRIGFLFK